MSPPRGVDEEEGQGLLAEVPRQDRASSSGHASSSSSRAPSDSGRDEPARRQGPGGKPSEVVGWLDLPNKDQLFVLAVCRLSEPLSNVCLLPYIFYLVRSVLTAEHTARDPDSGSGIDTSLAAEVSAYSGLLVAAFPLAQFFVSLPWGYLSDYQGRKFSIVIGLAISVIANAAFGFSRSFGALLFWRTLAGLANGNIGIMRTMTAEIVKERKFQTKAFLLLPLVFNSGMVFSLALGGILAEPAVSLPWLFGPQGLFNWCKGEAGVQWVIDFPYALPALMNSCMLAVAFLLSVFWLRETLAGKEDQRDVGVLGGQVVVRWFGRVVLRRKDATYMALKDVEEVFFASAPGTTDRDSRSRFELGEIEKPLANVTARPVDNSPTAPAVHQRRCPSDLSSHPAPSPPWSHLACYHFITPRLCIYSPSTSQPHTRLPQATRTSSPSPADSVCGPLPSASGSAHLASAAFFCSYSSTPACRPASGLWASSRYLS